MDRQEINQIHNRVFTKKFIIHVQGGKDEEYPIESGSLFDKFLAMKQEKIPVELLGKVQKHHLTMHNDFLNPVLALRAVMHKFCKDQNNEDLFLQALYALDAYVEVLKQHLAVYGEIVPESPEELAVMQMMEE